VASDTRLRISQSAERNGLPDRTTPRAEAMARAVAAMKTIVSAVPAPIRLFSVP